MLTNYPERFILKKVKYKIPLRVLFFLLLCIVLSFPKAHSLKNLILAKNSTTSPQNYPIKKPRYDYMSTFLSRNTKPLGLKEDLASKKLLSQSNIKWAIRAAERHILD